MTLPAGQSVVIIRAVNPVSVVCPEVILVNALTTLGVPEHPSPDLAFVETREASPDPAAPVRRVWQWTLLAQSRDGQYQTAELMQWWDDPAWLAAHPTHELAIIKVALSNLERLARRLRETPHCELYRRGKRLCLIPTHLPPERQAEMLKKFQSTSV